jgi:hypothetical protein
MERDAGRITPAGARVQIDPVAGVAPRISGDLDLTVVADRLQHLGVPVRVVAVVAAITGAEGEAATGVDAAEQWIEPARLVDQLVLHPLEHAFATRRETRLQGLGFVGLCRLDNRPPRLLSVSGSNERRDDEGDRGEERCCAMNHGHGHAGRVTGIHASTSAGHILQHQDRASPTIGWQRAVAKVEAAHPECAVSARGGLGTWIAKARVEARP